jgi:hypothetical protein
MAMLLCQFSCSLGDHIDVGAMMYWLYFWASNVALATSLKKSVDHCVQRGMSSTLL